jgi:hypothetical protein
MMGGLGSVHSQVIGFFSSSFMVFPPFAFRMPFRAKTMYAHCEKGEIVVFCKKQEVPL